MNHRHHSGRSPAIKSPKDSPIDISNGRMRILHIITEKTWRGGENQVRLLLEGAKDKAHWHIACPPESEAAKRLVGLGALFLIDTRSFLSFPKAVIFLARYCQKHRIQIVDCHSSKGHTLGLSLKLLFPYLKLVVHRRVDFPPKAGLVSTYKYQSEAIDRYVPISRAIESILIEAGISAQKLTTVRSAVDPSPFLTINPLEAKNSLQAEFGVKLAANSPIILNVAYHTEQKGMPTLIKALGILKQRGQQFTCLLAGEGHLTPELKIMAKQLQIEDQVLFLGIRGDIPRLLAAAEIFAFPSNKEGLGTSLIDAGFSHCAVAATKIGGIPEIIEHEKTGLLSEVGDAMSHAQNLERLLVNRELRERLAKGLFDHVSKEFTLKTMVDGNLSVYQELINEPQRKLPLRSRSR